MTERLWLDDETVEREAMYETNGKTNGERMRQVE